ncbi:MAG: WecB/TagA/CpsF family glycosyltransferase [Spirochaetales bacterium]|nr:WecB/TagA/CpsF family glycosyltransferase [Spirochaetales bacterium]
MVKNKMEGLERINFMNVPLDILKEDDIEKVIRNLARDGMRNQIVFLDFYEFMKARRDSERQRMLKEAALVLPVSKTLVRGSRFLKKGTLVRYMPFEFVIRLMGVLEQIGGTVYLLGLKNRELNISSGNLRDSFPGLRIVGRHAGFFDQEREKDIVMAIQKATPTLLLAGNGLKGKERWLLRRKKDLHPGITLWCGECFNIFCGKAKRISREKWERGLYKLPSTLKNPLWIFRLFVRLYYNLLLLVYKIRKL